MLINALTPIDVNLLPLEWGIIQDVVDFDREIAVLTTRPTIVNEIDSSTVEGKERLNALLITNYKGDVLPILPTCDCGKYQSQRYVGKICEECGYMVTPATEKPIEANVWIAAPEGIYALIHPTFWSIYSKLLTVSGVSILEWLVNASYRPPVENLAVFDILSEYITTTGTRYRRGLNSFIENFDGLFNLLTDGKTLRTLPPGVRLKMQLFVATHRHKLFPRYLPIPNKLAIIMEHTPTGIYSNESTAGTALDAVRSIAGIYATALPVTQTRKENRCVLAIKQLSAYYGLQFKESLGTKKGWNRKHGVGSRQDFSFRCVISGITEPHHYDEVWLPWGVGVGLFTVHIANYLLREGFTPNEVEQRIHWATLHYDPKIDEIFKRIIADSEDLGPAVIVQRNEINLLV